MHSLLLSKIWKNTMNISVFRVTQYKDSDATCSNSSPVCIYNVFGLSASAAALPARSIVIRSAQHVHRVLLAFSRGGPVAAIVHLHQCTLHQASRKAAIVRVEGSHADPFGCRPFLTLKNNTAPMKASLIYRPIRMKIEKEGVTFDRLNCIPSCRTIWPRLVLCLCVFQLQVVEKQKCFRFASQRNPLCISCFTCNISTWLCEPFVCKIQSRLANFNEWGCITSELGRTVSPPRGTVGRRIRDCCNSIPTIHHIGSFMIVVKFWHTTLIYPTTQYLYIVSILWKPERLTAIGLWFDNQNGHITGRFGEWA